MNTDPCPVCGSAWQPLTQFPDLDPSWCHQCGSLYDSRRETTEVPPLLEKFARALVECDHVGHWSSESTLNALKLAADICERKCNLNLERKEREN